MTSLWLSRTTRPASDPFPVDEQAEVIVVGAGLTGLITAVMVARTGRTVVVLEARTVGAVTTGNTTGKISLLQGTHLSSVLTAHSRSVAKAYLDGNRAGMAWLLGFCVDRGVAVERRAAFTYAPDRRARRSVRAEYRAGRSLGLDVSWRDTVAELPYPTTGAVVLPDQAQFDPVEALAALSDELRSQGGRIVEDTRVTGVRFGRRPRVETARGALSAEHVILASGVPFLDRGLYFAKTTAQRSYVAAYAVPGPIPTGMYLSAGPSSRSLRTAVHEGADLLLVGGNGHVVGRNDVPTTELVADLDRWTELHFAGARRTHTWSAQDYSSANHVPFVGRFPGGHGKVWLATGYSKWGMTNAAMAGLMLTAGLEGGRPSWAKKLQRRVTKPPAVANGLKSNSATGLQATSGWLKAELVPRLDAGSVPADGEGVLTRRGAVPTAVATADGTTCTVLGVCTHLGGILRYNDQERSWDCPLHGSRFAIDGTVLEGPATKPLPALDPTG